MSSISCRKKRQSNNPLWDKDVVVFLVCRQDNSIFLLLLLLPTYSTQEITLSKTQRGDDIMWKKFIIYVILQY